MIRHDYAYPLRIDAGAGQVARSSYTDHVEQMIRQLLLTSPGERVYLPEFGCGLRRAGVRAGRPTPWPRRCGSRCSRRSTRWLATRCSCTEHRRRSPAPTRRADVDQGSLLVTVSYTLVDTQ